ncbi:tetratricopeptide repeat protein [Lacinutrix sp. C3R15]|uniref:tetratricopeptide repeat-containing sensor histidine kinase n=1 Tax=Flavobacteriaceae TaxID=49546 RepID=UPI001C09F86C|nr:MULTISPECIES: tetratricopeptide repeat protein [Flavobacteriaceae]MBU2938914.1 tetratricopeptide repeat protein [Lacinutrix sp. C3R15]MDO6622227.1 tetratricopeptide repeat protein [Oceanihabitans sp. 1_MG-2023]
MLLFLGFNSFSQTSITENKIHTKDLVASISKQLQLPITDSIAFTKNMFKAVLLSKQANDKTKLIKSYHNLAKWHEGNTTLDSTIYYLEHAEKVSKDSKLSILEAETYLKKENAYKQRGDYDKAMTEDFKAIELFEKMNNQHGIAKSYTRLCDLLYYQEKYLEGAEYCQKAIDIQKELNTPIELAKSYRYKADNLLILERYDEALSTINKAITILSKTDNNTPDLGRNYNTRGNIYKFMQRYDDAIAEYKKCYKIAKDHNIIRGIIPALGNIGHVYRLQEKHKEALAYTLEAIDLMKKSGNTQNLRENYMHASDSYEALEEYKKALEYNHLYSDARFQELQQIIKQLESELQIKYESAKKDETIEEQDATINRQQKIQLLYIGIALLLGVILFGMFFTMRNIRKKRKALASLNSELAKNQEALENSNTKLKQSLEDLKATQAQLIQSEKMASLGELTAGIAHEIQNPLNFVNNFSEVNSELIDEMQEELDKGDIEEVKAISNDIKLNLEKINHHGKRADGIVKGMLLHSRNNSGEKEQVDLNKLADEYLRLAYHGLRAKDKSFNATLNTDFDPNLGKITVVSQDIGRVILNLFTNAFYAVNEKQLKTTSQDNYKPTVSVATLRNKDTIIITIKDNGDGIPKNIIDKIFQPFFTTKPTGKGTGLGLSMSYDIVTKGHGGELKMETKQGIGTTFSIVLPIPNSKKTD